MLDCLFVGIGGFIGTVCRYLIGLLPLEAENGFPFKTLFINITGSFLIGLIAALAAKNENLDPHILLLCKVGICGGFTTFSTFAYESSELMKGGHMAMALSYVCISVVFGVLAVLLAQFLVK